MNRLFLFSIFKLYSSELYPKASLFLILFSSIPPKWFMFYECLVILGIGFEMVKKRKFSTILKSISIFMLPVFLFAPCLNAFLTKESHNMGQSFY